jgi:hypothetical protein
LSDHVCLLFRLQELLLESSVKAKQNKNAQKRHMGSDQDTLLSFLRGTNTGGSSITGRGKKSFFSSVKSPNRLCTPPSILLNAKRWAHSRESSCIYLRGVHRENILGLQKIFGKYCISFGATAPPPVGQGLLIHEVSRSHTTTHHSR